MTSTDAQPLTRVLVIGVDGAEPEMLRQWVASGDLPNIAKLLERSFSGSTQNPYALEAGSVWPAFHTGLVPGKQPQFDGQRFFDASDYSFKWFDASGVLPNLWQHLSSQGKRCLIIDAPYVRLDPDLNGAMVLDWGAHVAADGQNMEFQTHPPELKDELLSLVGPDPAGGVPCDRRKLESLADYERFINNYLERIEKKAQLTVHMLKKGNWDFAETVFTDLHCLGHHTWHIRDRGHRLHQPRLRAALGDPLHRAFCALDKAVGSILDVLDDRTTAMLFLSHGMGAQNSGTGLLDKILSIIERGEPASWRDRPIKARVRHLWRKVPGEIRAPLRKLRKPIAGILDTTKIDLDRSGRRFFEVHANNATGGIRLNLKGRESNGVVEAEEAEALLEDIRSAVLEVRNVDTGEPIASDCIVTNKLYDGPYDSYLPDLLVVWNRTAPIRVVKSPRIGTVWQDYGDFRTGDHTPYGLFMAAGEQIEPAVASQATSIVDFFPTFLELLDGASHDSDGQPIGEILGRSVTSEGGEVDAEEFRAASAS